MSRSDFHDYLVFGLRVRSDIALPELFPATGEGRPDVVIRLGMIPESTARRRGVEAVEGGLLFVIKDAGRYRVTSGSEILVEPIAGIAERNVRLYLLGSVFGALLYQRRLLPLHANAVQIGRSAIAFMGESGSGKSTLAAWFHDRGFAIVADDVCVVKFDEQGEPIALPGLPRLRLWQEALEATGRDSSNFGRSYLGDDVWDKFDVPIGAETAAMDERPLAAIYVLDKGESFSICRIEGVEAADCVFAHTYRGAYVHVLKEQRAYWSAVTALVQRVPVYRLSRRWGLDRMDEEGRRILEHVLAEQAATP